MPNPGALRDLRRADTDEDGRNGQRKGPEPGAADPVGRGRRLGRGGGGAGPSALPASRSARRLRRHPLHAWLVLTHHSANRNNIGYAVPLAAAATVSASATRSG